MVKSVIKRNGSVEKYDPDKIKRVVMAAGLAEEKAAELVKNVNSWAKRQKKVKVTSLEIKDQVLKVIKELDRYASEQYAWYEGTKDKPQKS